MMSCRKRSVDSGCRVSKGEHAAVESEAAGLLERPRRLSLWDAMSIWLARQQCATIRCE